MLQGQIWNLMIQGPEEAKCALCSGLALLALLALGDTGSQLSFKIPFPDILDLTLLFLSMKHLIFVERILPIWLNI